MGWNPAARSLKWRPRPARRLSLFSHRFAYSTRLILWLKVTVNLWSDTIAYVLQGRKAPSFCSTHRTFMKDFRACSLEILSVDGKKSKLQCNLASNILWRINLSGCLLNWKSRHFLWRANKKCFKLKWCVSKCEGHKVLIHKMEFVYILRVQGMLWPVWLATER